MALDLQAGMVLSVPITVLDAKDGSNVRCLAGTRTVLFDGAFLRTADKLADAPPTPKDKASQLLETVQTLLARIESLEARQGAPA